MDYSNVCAELLVPLTSQTPKWLRNSGKHSLEGKGEATAQVKSNIIMRRDEHAPQFLCYMF